MLLVLKDHKLALRFARLYVACKTQTESSAYHNNSTTSQLFFQQWCMVFYCSFNVFVLSSLLAVSLYICICLNKKWKGHIKSTFRSLTVLKCLIMFPPVSLFQMSTATDVFSDLIKDLLVLCKLSLFCLRSKEEGTWHH